MVFIFFKLMKCFGFFMVVTINAVVLFVGVAMVWSGIAYLSTNVDFWDLFRNITEIPERSTMIGVGLILAAMLGLIAAYAYSRFLLMLYTIVLIALVITLYVFYPVVKYDFHEKKIVLISNEIALNKTENFLEKYNKYYERHVMVTFIFDWMHQYYNCCGTTGPDDFTDIGVDVPASCTNTDDGCAKKLTEKINDGKNIFLIKVIVAYALLGLLIVSTIYLIISWRRPSFDRAISMYYPEPK